jgi:antitoxin VapB
MLPTQGRSKAFNGRMLPMSLNIKNSEAHDLARELADLTGESMSAAVTTAIRERRDRMLADRSGGLAVGMLKIGRDCAARLPDAVRQLDHGELLYGEDGLPA